MITAVHSANIPFIAILDTASFKSPLGLLPLFFSVAQM